MSIQWGRNKNITRHKYMDGFSKNSKPNSVCTKSKIEKAYEQAAKTREFEIELYWKRAGYFWAFIVSIYTAFFSVQKEFYYDKCTGFTHGAIPLLVLSALGFFFCLAWLLSSKASKFWQENWESHIDLLEDYVTGPLYKTYRASASFSVSKINIAAGYVISVCSAGLFVFETVHFCKNLKSLPSILAFVSILALTICGCAAFLVYGKGNASNSGEIEFDRKVYDGDEK
ncbi:MAG: hypothetical protein HDR55_07110 [Treponema sp.]|nr:hypothetical protein [Treponema sp.]MBD5442942.1 hypothetical protein [Treponema sp.]